MQHIRHIHIHQRRLPISSKQNLFYFHFLWFWIQYLHKLISNVLNWLTIFIYQIKLEWHRFCFSRLKINRAISIHGSYCLANIIVAKITKFILLLCSRISSSCAYKDVISIFIRLEFLQFTDCHIV